MAEHPEMKRCSTCKEYKSATEYTRNKRMVDGLHYSCRGCVREQKNRYRLADPVASVQRQRDHRKNNPEVWDVYYLRKRLKKHGLTEVQYYAMLEAQNHQCPICSRQLTTGKQGTHIDHNHRTGAVRALTCGQCNPMLGYAGENPDVLLAAAAYLIRHEALGTDARLVQPAETASLNQARSGFESPVGHQPNNIG